MTDTPDTNVVPENELARRRAAVDNSVNAVKAILELARTYAAFEELEVPTAVWLPNVIAALPEPYNTTFGPGAERSGAAMVDLIAAFTRGGTTAAMEALPNLVGRILGNPDGEPSLFATLGARFGMAVTGLGREHPVVQRPGAIGDPDGGGDDELADVDASVAAARMRIRIAKLFEDAPRMTLPDGSPDPSQAPALECTLVLRGSIPPIQGVLSTTEEGGLRFMTPTRNSANEPVMLEQFFDYSDVIAVCIEREVKATRRSLIHTS